jgi:hypothetical protein
MREFRFYSHFMAFYCNNTTELHFVNAKYVYLYTVFDPLTTSAQICKNLGAISNFYASEGWYKAVPYWRPTKIRRHRT